MPSTFTNNGGIELPADGEKDGVWGDVVNLNMQIVDRLTNGVGAISLTGTTHTLTTANGVLSDGQYALVVFGGAPSGTNTVTISPNDAEKIYFVRNTTAQSVVMTQGSGGDVTIPTGTGAIIYANGAGTGAAVADLTATFIPDLTNAGVTASTAELNLLDGVTASTAELNYVDGVTSAIQTQLDAAQTAIGTKQATITGAATTIASDDLAVSRALVSDGSGKVAASDVTSAELDVLDGLTASTAELNLLDGVTATTAEINYLGGVTSAIQTQLDAKAPDNELTQVEVEDDTSTVFGQVSGERLNQSIEANLNVTGGAPMYACRAWVNFNGTGTVAIRASGNVSSITDNGTGDYTVNFTTAMPDADYAVVGLGSNNAADITFRSINLGPTANVLAGSCRILGRATNFSASVAEDLPVISVSIFR